MTSVLDAQQDADLRFWNSEHRQDTFHWATDLVVAANRWRDREQARNLCQVLSTAPAEPLLIWTGGDHACKEPTHGWVTMGCHFPAMAGTDPFVIDQNVTVDHRLLGATLGATETNELSLLFNPSACGFSSWVRRA